MRFEMEDNELLYMIRQKDEVAFSCLEQKYQSEIQACLGHYLKLNHRHQDMEDFYQMALMKLIESVEEYQWNHSSFHCYYFNVLRNSAIDVLRSMNTFNARQDLYTVSLDMIIEDNDGSHTYMETLGECHAKKDTYESIVYSEFEDLKKGLSEMEVEILKLRSLGSSYRQIAQDLHISKKKVENTMVKVRKRQKTGLYD